MKLVFGKKRVAEPPRRENDADNVWGAAWHAWRSPDGYVLDYATGDMAGSERRLAISADAFARLLADPGSSILSSTLMAGEPGQSPPGACLRSTLRVGVIPGWIGPEDRAPQSRQP